MSFNDRDTDFDVFQTRRQTQHLSPNSGVRKSLKELNEEKRNNAAVEELRYPGMGANIESSPYKHYEDN